LREPEAVDAAFGLSKQLLAATNFHSNFVEVPSADIAGQRNLDFIRLPLQLGYLFIERVFPDDQVGIKAKDLGEVRLPILVGSFAGFCELK